MFDACAQTGSCENIDLDSAGVHSFDHSKILGIATSHGLHGVADYVLIVPPGASANVKQLIIVADVTPLPDAKCARDVDPVIDPTETLLNCAQSIPGQGLKLIAQFPNGEPAQALKQMPSLMEYVAHIVLCSAPALVAGDGH